MFSRKKRDEDVIGPSRGFQKFATHFFRFFLFPLIHPVWFVFWLVLISFVVIVIPASQRVDFKDVPRWYMDVLKPYYHKSVSVLKPVLQKAESDSRPAASSHVSEKPVLATYSIGRPTNRRAFEQVEEQNENVDEPVQQAENKQEQIVAVKETMPQQKPISFKRAENLGLVYLPQPKIVIGVLKIVNANEIKLGEMPLFLYGIYAAPSSENGTNAFLYLQKEFADKLAECYIGAYAADGTATAICVCDGININQKLVELGYSKDVSLN